MKQTSNILIRSKQATQVLYLRQLIKCLHRTRISSSITLVSFREDMQKGRDIFTTGKRIVVEKEANSQSKDKPQHLSYTLVTYNLTEQTLSQKKKGTISLTPSNFTHFCRHPPNIQKLSLTHLELSKILTYPHPYKLRPKYPCFSFLKKIKKTFWKLTF
jgi:hypothetical protein